LGTQVKSVAVSRIDDNDIDPLANELTGVPSIFVRETRSELNPAGATVGRLEEAISTCGAASRWHYNSLKMPSNGSAASSDIDSVGVDGVDR
jgi:hypothetical protein